MDSTRWDAIRAQFDQLADLDEPARREQLAVLATTDPSLRRDVELLLHADINAEERLAAMFTPLGLGGDAGERLTRHVSTEVRQRLEEALSGAYRIEGEMTGGGSSRVFAAVEVALERHVVIKLLPPELAEAVSVDRFRRECLLVAQLQHPHIVPLLAAGTAADLLYYTMPLVEGESLRQRLERDGALPIADAIGILREVADALDYASTHGVVHRDVKPGNVMLSAGHALLTDFGIAKALDRPSDATTLTSPALAIGTPTYMAPEQASGAPVDHRTDLYALGVLGYEMLAGVPPFMGDGVREVLLAHVIAIPEPISARRLDVPAPLAALIMRCLAKEPIDRPQSAREVYDALVALGAGGTLVALGAPAPSKADGKGEQLTPGLPTASKDRAIAAPGSAPRFLTIAAPVAVVAVIAVVAAVALNRRPAVSQPVLDEHRLLIAPFRNESGDSTLDALGTMVADWLTRGVVETGLADPLAASVSRRRDGSVVAGDLAGTALLSQARAQAARRIVSGSYYVTGESLQFHARITDASDARTLGSVAPAVAWRGSPMLAIDAIRTRVIGALASMNPTEVGGIVSADAPPSFAAYREFLRGEEEFSRGAFEQSIVHDRNALALDSTYLAPMVRMVYAHFNLQQCAQAESLGRVLRARREQLPAYEGFYLDRGLAWCAGDVNAAYRAAKQMLAVSPHASYAKYIAARSAYLMNRPLEAVEGLERLDWSKPHISGYYDDLTTALHMLRRHEREFEVALLYRQRHPGSLLPTQDLVRAQCARGKWDDVRRLVAGNFAMTSWESVASPATVALTAAGECAAHGNEALSRDIAGELARWLEGRPRSEDGDLQRLQARVTAGDLTSAAPIARELAVRFPESVRHLRAAGVVAAMSGKGEEAERMLVALGRLRDPYLRGENIHAQAAIAARLGDRARAVMYLREAIRRGWNQSFLNDADVDLLSLRGFAPFDELMAPRG